MHSGKEYYNNDLMVPIFNYGKKLPVSTKDVAEILLDGSVPNDRICTSVPVFVQHNVDFIVAREKFGDWRDVKNDFNYKMNKVKTKNLFCRDQ